VTRAIGRSLLLGPGLLLFIVAVPIPLIALAERSIALGPSGGGWEWLTVREWGLFGYSVRLAAVAAVTGVLLSLPAAYVVGRIGRPFRHPILGAMLLAPLLLPPMVYVFGWGRFQLAGSLDEGLCVWVWASWLWPIPALLIGTTWARRGRDAYQAAVLDTSPGRAFATVVLPLLAGAAGAGGLAVFTLCLTEYSVPHACGLTVLATAMLGDEMHSGHPADVLRLAWPLLAVVVLALGALYAIWRRRSPYEGDDAPSALPDARRGRLLGLVLLVDLVTVVLPVLALISRLPSLAPMKGALRTYATELWTSVAIAAAAGVAAVWMGLSVIAHRRLRPLVVVGALTFGVLPAALVGHAVLTAYLPVGFVYNTWLLLALGYLARFGWIGVLIGWLAWRSAGSDVVAQARTDGADEFAITFHLRYRPSIALLLCGVAVVAAMSLADVALPSLLTVPGIAPISGTLIEKFHRFEDEMLVSLSLWLVAGALPAAVLGWAALRLRRREIND